MQALFPTEDSTQETHVQRKKRETVNTYSSTILDKQFTKQEITYAISTMKKKKAPGIDGISIEIIKELHDMNPDILHYTYNKCLELGNFPETWKKGKLIIFNKPGKGPSLPNAYRPICFLSVLGKILDKLLVFRIIHLLHKNNKLHKQQHGFRNGRSCETANFRLWQAINIALQERVPVTLLSLDVQGAFDTVWRTSILFHLTQANCPQNIFNLVRNYFTNRSIHYFQDEEVWNFDNQRGVPQGSCSGPLFWNLVMDTALDLPLSQSEFPFDSRQPSPLIDSDIDDKVAKNKWLLKESPFQKIQPNFSYKKFSSIKTVRLPDGTLEEHRTVTDSQGNTTTTIRRSIGDQSYEVTTHSDEKGLKEKDEKFINLDENDLPNFEKKWKNIKSENIPVPLPNMKSKSLEPTLNPPAGDPSYMSLFKKFFGF
ncbi:Retrovirus-related Pol polyprotein from type-1 retrotransposable element R1 [Araneus ventricosus]|uniref:Retrovirus-related Pol polyprotein from type-1 retrotransposable element R1 n=1 Tax=Araneus ventricosus TaxID=182803 RepID=A0A4Y2P108_ARAVE|nr:Retrovirus-related Pol polyprotein from type-1 retrotransposable element R1 [Araneus ventricosus]